MFEMFPFSIRSISAPLFLFSDGKGSRVARRCGWVMTARSSNIILPERGRVVVGAAKHGTAEH